MYAGSVHVWCKMYGWKYWWLAVLSVRVSAYDGPYEDSPESPDGRVKTIQVLNVTPDSTKTEETDSDNDIPTIPTGY